MRITLLKMFTVTLTRDFKISIHDCEKNETTVIEYDENDSSAVNQAAMYLNRQGVMITHMAILNDDTISILTE